MLAARSRLPWLAAVILAVGVAASATGALAWRSSARTRERESFQTTATNVSGTLETLLRRHTDFVRSVRAVLTMEPDVSPSRLQRWFEELEDREAQPLGFGATVTRKVMASELATFLARRNADPAFRRFVGGRIEPFTPNGRPYYCLLAAGSANITFAPELSPLLQTDWCDPASLIGGYRTTPRGLTRSQATKAITETGQFAVYPLHFGGISSLIIEGAFYRRGVPLKTPAQRRAAVLGWTSGSFNIPLLMQTALGGLRGLRITLYHTNAGVPREFIGSYGRTAGAHQYIRQTTAHVDGTWLISVSGRPLAGLSPDVQALAVLLGGILATILLCALVTVLSRSRQRALELVRQKTRQLEHQATHDALTGLPNRTLTLDRAVQLLARREHGEVAALYVDLDGFKEVNDSFGHAAGDELLRTVATRLQSVLREADTAARLGGDEFLVLVDGSQAGDTPEIIAQRLLNVLREPYELAAGGAHAVVLSASMGIALGSELDAEELIRRADVALYEAKTAGRNRYAFFSFEMDEAVAERLACQMPLAPAPRQPA
jgi:diguanylate cyclase (GGDEF)-like protein